MKKTLFAVALLIQSATWALAEELAPPALYEDKGACPFEGCTYSKWKVKSNVDCFQKAKSKTKVLQINKGQEIIGKTGNVYVKPVKVTVLKAWEKESFKRGDYFYVLTEEGESVFKTWENGKIGSRSMFGVWNISNIGGDPCTRDKANCWAEAEEKYKEEWWAQIEYNNKLCWIDMKKAKLGGVDSLGGE